MHFKLIKNINMYVVGNSIMILQHCRYSSVKMYALEYLHISESFVELKCLISHIYIYIYIKMLPAKFSHEC